jgi:tRNA-dihydrouridine synthase A
MPMRCASGPARNLARARKIVAALLPYVEKQLARGVHLRAITRHISVCTTAVRLRTWRRMLSDATLLQGGSAELLGSALRRVEPEKIADAA